MYRKYYSYNDMPKPIKPPKPQENNVHILPEKKPQKDIVSEAKRKENFLSRFEKDDLILAGVLLVLLMDDCDDWTLIAVIGGLLFFDN